jgi:UDP-N-acetylglucosamine acyltransferase
MNSIHPTAVIHPETELASDVRVGAYSMIGPGVQIDAGTEIGPHVVIDGPTKIGKDCRFFPFASIGQIPQDLKFHGERSELVIGNSNVFREFVTFHRGTEGGGKITEIGHDNFFMAYAHVAHDCKIGSFVIMANAATLAGHVTIEDHCVVGAFTGIHQFCRVGKYGFIGGYSVITKDVLPFSKTVGSRGAHCYGMNTIGLRRKGFDEKKLRILKKAYRLLLQAKLNTRQALEAITKEVPQIEEVAYLTDFIRSSQRGIIK